MLQSTSEALTLDAICGMLEAFDVQPGICDAMRVFQRKRGYERRATARMGTGKC